MLCCCHCYLFSKRTHKYWTPWIPSCSENSCCFSNWTKSWCIVSFKTWQHCFTGFSSQMFDYVAVWVQPRITLFACNLLLLFGLPKYFYLYPWISKITNPRYFVVLSILFWFFLQVSTYFDLKFHTLIMLKNLYSIISGCPLLCLLSTLLQKHTSSSHLCIRYLLSVLISFLVFLTCHY